MEVREPNAKYLERPAYKQTEVGVIPEDWDVSTIADLANTSSGTTPSRAQAERYFGRGNIPWVKTLDLNNGSISETEEAVTPTALAETSLQLYPDGAVLVAMYGGYNQIGRTGLLKIPATINQALTAICPDVKRLVLEHINNDTCIMLSHIHPKTRSWPCDRPNCILPMRIAS